MKKLMLAFAGVLGAIGVFYISRTAQPPANEEVQGALGGRKLDRGATICVSQIQNLSGKAANLEGIDDELVGQLSNAGFKARLNSGDGAACEATVYGEIIALKGKDKMEAQLEFRLVVTGEQTPAMSSVAKGKSSDAIPEGAISAAFPGTQKPAARDAAAIEREAIVSALADAARQVKEQRPSRPTRAALY